MLLLHKGSHVIIAFSGIEQVLLKSLIHILSSPSWFILVLLYLLHPVTINNLASWLGNRHIKFTHHVNFSKPFQTFREHCLIAVWKRYTPHRPKFSPQFICTHTSGTIQRTKNGIKGSHWLYNLQMLYFVRIGFWWQRVMKWKLRFNWSVTVVKVCSKEMFAWKATDSASPVLLTLENQVDFMVSWTDSKLSSLITGQLEKKNNGSCICAEQAPWGAEGAQKPLKRGQGLTQLKMLANK